MATVCLLITAHTTRHLRCTLLGAAFQSRPADRVVLSCDNDRPDLRDAAAEWAREFSLPMLIVQRPFTGAAHCGQVRNNAVRALLRSAAPPPPESLLVCLDQDCIPDRRFLESHERLFASGDPVLAFRVDLTPEQTESITEADIRSGRSPAEPTPAKTAALRRRHRRLVHQSWLRRLGIAKAHKPKILGANFSVSLRSYLAVNGFDETYRGYGQEDDDFVRRLYAIGCRPSIGVLEAMVYHQYHETRAPTDWHDGPNARRFPSTAPAHCAIGVDSPPDRSGQSDITVYEAGPRAAGSPDADPPPQHAKDKPLQPTARADGGA